jgi:hypothetical protein
MSIESGMKHNLTNEKEHPEVHEDTIAIQTSNCKANRSRQRNVRQQIQPMMEETSISMMNNPSTRFGQHEPLPNRLAMVNLPVFGNDQNRRLQGLNR